MRIVHVNSEINESSVPNRIRVALMKEGIITKILTSKTDVMDDDIIVVDRSFKERVFRRIDTVLRCVTKKIWYPDIQNLPFSFYYAGIDISKNSEIQQADIIVLHWICGTFMSTRNIIQLAKLHKPVVMVCHDSWYFTGGCHVRLGCEKYKKSCGQCPELRSSRKRDWSYQLIKLKQKAYRNLNLWIVSPSHWMNEHVAQSALLGNARHWVIPNPIDTERFTMKRGYLYGEEETNCITLSYGAIGAIETQYKGYKQLMEALAILDEQFIDGKEIRVLVFGSDRGIDHIGRINIHYLGYLKEKEMIDLYHKTDIFVMPSLDDNLPGTVMESLSCGTPVVAFKTGGIPDMIQHKKNGYLAEYGNATDLAAGIYWVMNNNKDNELGIYGNKFIREHFSENEVAIRYMELFREIEKEGN